MKRVAIEERRLAGRRSFFMPQCWFEGLGKGAVLSGSGRRQDESMTLPPRAIAISYCLHIVFRAPLRGDIGTMI